MSNRMHRCFKLLADFRSGKTIRSKDMLQRVGMHRRTLFRYLKDLRAEGFAIRFDRAAKGYRLDGPSPACDGGLTREEWLAIALAFWTGGLQLDESARTLLTKSLEKLQVSVEFGLRKAIDRIGEVVIGSVEPTRTNGSYSIYSQLVMAAIDLKCVRIKSRGCGQQTTLATVGILSSRDGWNLIAGCPSDKSLQSIALTAIGEVQVLAKTFDSDQFAGWKAWANSEHHDAKSA